MRFDRPPEAKAGSLIVDIDFDMLAFIFDDGVSGI
jgi:hypothetical protein